MERMARVAQGLGVPKDQLENFLRGGYVAQPKQLEFHAACRQADLAPGPTQIGFGGARGPGKSHATFAQIALDDCQRQPELKVLYIRRIAKNAREQFEDLRRGVLKATSHEYKVVPGLIIFPNGSRIVIGHFKNESDVDQYLGLEYDIIVIEEATTLTHSKYQTLRDSNRTSKPGWRPRIYATTNPGNVGHAWFRTRFIEPAREHRETDTRFIFATIDDNRFVDPDYKLKLEENIGWKLRAYRHGDWDIAAGQYFHAWNYETHVCEPFQIPPHWPIWAGFDYGFTHPTAVIFLTEHDGTLYVIGEHVESRALPSWHALTLQAMMERWSRTPRQVEIFAGADVFAQRGDASGRTIAKQYADHGIRLDPAAMDRVSGWGECLTLLGDPRRNIPSRIRIFNTCRHLIETIPACQHNPARPEDVQKWDVDEDGNGGDDTVDALRYAILTRRKRTPTVTVHRI